MIEKPVDEIVLIHGIGRRMHAGPKDGEVERRDFSIVMIKGPDSGYHIRDSSYHLCYTFVIVVTPMIAITPQFF